MTRLPNDFKEFLQLLNRNQVRYLLVGGFAVGYYGYVRATTDIDIWVAVESANAVRLVAAVEAFGFAAPELTPEAFLNEHRIIRMGLPPLRIELLTSISGVSFDACYEARVGALLDGISVDLISLQDLKRNKGATGRAKDLADLEQLP